MIKTGDFIFFCKKYTYEKENISPLLEWDGGTPQNTESFILVMDSNEREPNICNHWIIYNISKYTSHLDEGIKKLPYLAQAGLNSWEKDFYIGPCPQLCERVYYFKLYALDKKIEPCISINRDGIEGFIKYDIIDLAILVGKCGSNK